MSFIYSLPWAGQAFFFLLFIYWGYVLWRNRRKAVQEYQDVLYEPDGRLGEESWRWSSSPPEVNLPVEQADGRSCVQLHPIRSSNEMVFGILGLGLAGLTVWLAVMTLFQSSDERVVPPGMVLAALLVMALLACGLCSVDAPITAIVRTRDRLILKIRFAAFFHRTKVFRARHANGLVFRGAVQGLLEMNTDQLDRLPDINLFASRRFRPSKRFLLRCTPTQASWIVGGLNQWKDVVTKG